MNFDFTAKEKEAKVTEMIFEKKSVLNKIKGFKMNLSLDKIPAGIWSVLGIILAVIAMHYKVENIGWAIPVACMLYYASTYVVPFSILAVTIAGMSAGMPNLVYLLIFSIVTMIPWSKID